MRFASHLLAAAHIISCSSPQLFHQPLGITFASHFVQHDCECTSYVVIPYI